MIRQLRLLNFKCFREQLFELRPLSILCGLNGVGKSSAIQSLLIAQQASRLQVGASRDIPLNGPFRLELGTVGDIVNHDASASEIGIELTSDNTKSLLRFDASASHLENHYISATLDGHGLPEPFQASGGFRFTYLSAERQGPRDTQQMQSRPLDELRIGTRGEFSAEILVRFEREDVREKMCHPSTQSENKKLNPQVEHWMNEWAPDIQIKPEWYPGTNVAAIRIRTRGVRSEWMRPTNVGFGISHCLPIVIAGLLATEDSLLIVDTPEAHLHPAGQSSMGNFLATVAASGVQVLVETHSDHILNGIRKAISRSVISHEDVIFDFVTRPATDEETASPLVEALTADAQGKIARWPRHFFDQFEIDLLELP